jgi:hypothetical protein
MKVTRPPGRDPALWNTTIAKRTSPAEARFMRLERIH